MPEEDSRAIHFQEAAAIVRLCAEVQCERMAPDFDVDDDTEAVARKLTHRQEVGSVVATSSWTLL